MAGPQARRRTCVRSRPRKTLILAAAASAARRARAGASFTWDAGATPDRFWGTAANWALDGVPGSGTTPSTGSNDVVTFSSTTAGVFGTVDLNARSYSIDVVNFTNTSQSYAVTNGTLSFNTLNSTQNSGNSFTNTLNVIASNALTANVSQNQFQLQGKLTTGAGGLIKTGGGTLRLGTSGTAFEGAIGGNIFLNGGAITVSAGTTAGANNPIGGTGTEVIVGAAGTTLTLQSQLPGDGGTYDFGRNIQFGTFGGTLSASASTTTPADPGDSISRTGDISIGAATLNVTGGNGYALAADRLILGGGQSVINATTSNLTLDALTGPAASSLLKTGGSSLVLNGDNSATFAGALVDYRGGGANAINAAGGVGNAVVTVGGVATDLIGTPTEAAILNYGASGATGNSSAADDVTINALGQVNLGFVPAATDSFRVRAFGVLQGGADELNALGASNLVAEPNAVLAYDTTPANGSAPAGLADKSVFLGLSANLTSQGVTVGAGTPWLGLSNDRNGRSLTGTAAATPAVITVNGGDDDVATIEAVLQGLNAATLTLGTAAVDDAAYRFASASRQKVTLAIRGFGGLGTGQTFGGNVEFADNAETTGLAAAVDKILVQSGTLSLRLNNSLGRVPVEVQAGGALNLVSTATENAQVDAAVLVRRGGVLYLNENVDQVNLNGSFTVEGGGTLDAGTPNVFTMTQPVKLTGTGHTIRLRVDNIVDLDLTVADDATYVVAGGTRTQTGGITLNELGLLTNDNGNRTFNGPVISSGPSLRLAATTGTTLTLASALDVSGKAVSIEPAGILDFQVKGNLASAAGSTTGSVGSVLFTGRFRAGSATIGAGVPTVTTPAAGGLAFDNADVNVAGDINVNSGVLYLSGGGGPVAGSTNGKLTARLTTASTAVADRVADRIVVAANGRIEMAVTDPGAGLRHVITQPFVVGAGDLNPGDKRNFVVGRQGALTTGTPGVTFNDLTLNAGSVLAIDELNTDVRARLKLAGNATATTNDSFDYTDVVRDASLPAYDGTNPVVLSQGRLSESFLGSIVYGTIGQGVQVDLLKGGLTFQPGSSMHASAVVNSLGNPDNTNAPFDGSVTINSGRDGTNFLTGGRINLAGNQDVTALVDEVATTTPTPTPRIVNRVGTTMAVVAGQQGLLVANRGIDSANNGYVRFENVELGNNARVNLQSTNTAQNVADITLTGTAATVANTDGDATDQPMMYVGDVESTIQNAVLTVAGAQQMRFVGKLTGADVAINLPTHVTSFLVDRASDAANNLGSAFDLNGRTIDVNGGILQAGLNVSSGTIRVGDRALTLQHGASGAAASSYAGLTIRGSAGPAGGAVMAMAADVAVGPPAAVNAVNTVAATVDLVGPANSLVSERDGADTANNGRVVFSTVNGARGNVDLHRRNDVGLSIGQLNVTGPLGVNNNALAAVQTVAAGTNRVTFAGGSRTEITGNVTSGPLVVSGTQGVEFNPGAGNTSAVGAASVTVNSTLAARSGTTDLGRTLIAGNPAGTTVAGLREGRITGTTDVNLATPNPNNFGIQLSPRLAQTSLVSGNPNTGWSGNETWIYTGQVYDADGVFTFVENVDDDAVITINGQQVLQNKETINTTGTSASTTTNSGATAGFQGSSGTTFAGANNASAAGTKNFGPDDDGWYDIEIRLQNSGGGAGPTLTNGFTNYFGLGMSPTGDTATAPAGFAKPLDDGTMSLFRTTTAAATGAVRVDGGATLAAGGYSNLGRVTFAGTGTAALNLAGPVGAGGVASSSDVLEVTDTAAGVLTVARGPDTVTAINLNVAGGGATFAKAGPGTLVASGAGVGTGPVRVDGGSLVVNGSVGGAVAVNATATLGGNGAVAGAVAVNDGGTIAPGNSVGTLTTGDETWAGGGRYVWEITDPAAAPGSGWDLLQLNAATLAIDPTAAADKPFTIQIAREAGDTFDENQWFTIAQVGAITDGTNTGVAAIDPQDFVLPDSLGGPNWEIRAVPGDVSGFNIQVSPRPVPEPAALSLLALGGTALLGRRRRRAR